MGRILDLCAEIAAEADEGPEGLVLSADAWDRLKADWPEDDIEDAIQLVTESALYSELVESADSVNARLLDLLGTFAEAAAFRRAEEGVATIGIDAIQQLARRVARLEEALEGLREGAPPDRRGFDALQRRLADYGIEAEMERGRGAPEPLLPGREDEEE